MSQKGTSPPGGGDRRQQARQGDPYLVIRFAGHDYTSVNWSFGGMLVSGYYGDMGPGALVTITAMAVGEEPAQAVTVSARAVRADRESGHLALNFLDIDTVAYGLLARRYG